jgi:hypothetical protein
MRESTLKPPGVLKDAEGNPVPIYGGWPLPSPGSHPSAASYAAALGRMREETLMQPGDLMYWEGTPASLARSTPCILL